MEKLSHENWNGKKAGIVILIPDKIDFKTKNVVIEGYYFMIKRLIQ